MAHAESTDAELVPTAERLVGDGTITPDQSEGAQRHPLFIAAISLAGACLLAIALLGATVARGSQLAFDRAILLAMRETAPGAPGAMVPEGPEWLRQSMIDITALGGGTVLTLVVAAVAGLLLIQRHVLTAALLVAGTLSGSWMVRLAKSVVGRERPEVIDHLIHIGSASFPSGHSANSAVAYLTLAILLTQIVSSRAQRLYLLGVAVALVLVVGFSRVYLGVHWPSDVIAGWSFGTLWALIWWAIGAALRRRYARP